MKRLTRHIALLLLAAIAAACADDPDPVERPTDSGEVELHLSVQFPGIAPASTRTWEGENPDYDNLELYCLVFQDNGRPSANYLLQVKPLSHDPAAAGAANGEDGKEIPFTVTLSATGENAVLHFIAVEKDLPDNPIHDVDFGVENVIIPRMTTAGGHEAYWQRVQLGCPISAASKERIHALLKPVPLIRNFSKISLDTTEEVDAYFELKGFCVVNTFDRGTIAPYSETQGFAKFVEMASGRRYTPLSYDQIVKQNSRYAGTRPTGGVLDKKIPAPEDFPGNTDPKYIYERSVSETDHTFILVAGIFKGHDAASSASGGNTVTYYKLDIGKNDRRGLFNPYHLLRNFEYRITIRSVDADGYLTPEQAVAGMTYNNLSADINTQHLLSISDGKEMIHVNYTSRVIVDGKPFELWYRYFELNDNTIEGSTQLKNVVVWNDDEIGCIAGDVIAKAGEKLADTTDYVMQGQNRIPRNWERIRITPNTPTSEMRIQTVTLYKENGLSRKVTLYLREPWTLSDVATYAGRHDGREDRPDESEKGVVSKRGGRELTIFFELPVGLPKAMFPLEFVIESNRQNIENDKNGTIVVRSAPSMFDDVQDYRIQYIKTVRWEEYDPDNRSDDPQSREDNYDEAGNYLGNIIRCRFLTITDLTADNIDQPRTTVLIDNPYFVRASTTFDRTTLPGDDGD